MDENTRDIAIQAKALVDMHMQDCVRVRDALFDKFNQMSAESKANFKAVNDDLKQQTRLLALIIGGLIVISRLPDFLAFFDHSKAGP